MSIMKSASSFWHWYPKVACDIVLLEFLEEKASCSAGKTSEGEDPALRSAATRDKTFAAGKP
jgi:hypothetical protein